MSPLNAASGAFDTASSLSPALVTQTLDFTCGAAAALEAMAALKPHFNVSVAEEYALWRDANSVHMGDGEPGCTHHGLAAALSRRGFDVLVHSSDHDAADRLFRDAVSLPLHRSAFNRAMRAHHRAAVHEGVTYHTGALSVNTLAQFFDRGYQPLLLTRSAIEEAEHWRHGLKVEGRRLFMSDPCRENRFYQEREQGTARLSYTEDELTRMASFGGHAPVHVLLAIGNRPH